MPKPLSQMGNLGELSGRRPVDPDLLAAVIRAVKAADAAFPYTTRVTDETQLNTENWSKELIEQLEAERIKLTPTENWE